MKLRRAVLLLVFSTAFFGCDSTRLDQFSSFSAAGTLYVGNFHQLTSQAGSTMIASDSAVLVVAREQAGSTLGDHRAEFARNVRQDDKGIEDYLTTLQKLDGHASLLGSYFSAITELTNGKADSNVTTAADSLLDSINAFNPQIEKATVAGQPIKNFVQPATSLIVGHFEVKALNEHLKKAAPVIDEALTLQEAAVDALTAQIKSSQAASLEVRETTDVINPYVASGNLATSWTSSRGAFLRDSVAINGLNSAKSAISQLHATFRQLVQDKDAKPDFTTLLATIEKMSGYIAAVQATSTAQTSNK